MKNICKSILSILLITSLVFSFAACGADEGLKRWVEENKEDLIQLFDDGESEVGVEAKGKNIVVTVRTAKMDNASDADIEKAEEGFNLLAGILKMSLQQAKDTEEDLKKLECFEVKFCNSKGEKITEFKIQLD